MAIATKKRPAARQTPAAPPVEVVIPYSPRPLQRTLHRLLDAHRFGVAVCHRRFGKTVCGVNQLIKAAMLCKRERPRFAYLAPTYAQGKKIAFDYLKHFSTPIPGSSAHETELRINLPNGAEVRIYGADNPDSLRGIYLDGVVLDEFGLMARGIFSEVIRPLISDRQGWAFFIGTPNGKNQFYDIAQEAQKRTDWFFASYRASETKIIQESELASARSMMTDDEYQQEFECSFEASVKGAVFAKEMQQVRDQGRITRIPYDPVLPVDTDWDLGISDQTAIWFSQTLYTGEVRLIDYYENSGYGLDHYRQVLSDRHYTYGTHWAPHDIQVRELGTGNSRLEAARLLGLHFQVGPKVEDLQDGIHAARMLLPRCYFDGPKTEMGIECLKNYAWDYNQRIQSFTGHPLHNQWSHGADAFRGLAYRHYVARRRPEADAARAIRAAQKDPGESWTWSRQRQGGRGGY